MYFAFPNRNLRASFTFRRASERWRRKASFYVYLARDFSYILYSSPTREKDLWYPE